MNLGLLRVPSSTVAAINRRGGRVIAGKVAIADSFLARLTGLIGTVRLQEGEGLLITPCSMVHMLFMRFPIDVVFLDADLHILHLESDLRPWRLSPYIPGARFALELPAGTIARHSLSEGVEILFAPVESLAETEVV